MSDDLEEEILQLSRNGLTQELITFIESNPGVNLNCQGKFSCINVEFTSSRTMG